MMSEKLLPAVVGAVYDCVAEPGRWQGALDLIRESAEGHLALLAVVDPAHPRPRFSAASGDPAVVAPLVGGLAEEMPFYAALPRLEIDVPVTIDTLYDIQGPGTREAWLGSRVAREWAAPNQLDDCFWVALMQQPARVANLIVITHQDRHQITDEEMRLFALLAPHVRRAVTIGDLFDDMRERAELFRSVVDSLVHPVIIVGSDMTVLFANPAAEKLLRDGALGVTRGKLRVAYAPAASAIERAVRLGEHDELALGPAGINVPLAHAARPAVAHVMPLARRDRSVRPAPRAAAAIFVAAPGIAPIPAIEAIAALFGLTAAEKRVAAQVADGGNRAAIAAAAGVSDATVKTQLSAIFDKTGAGDQRELELLMRDLSPPVTNA